MSEGSSFESMTGSALISHSDADNTRVAQQFAEVLSEATGQPFITASTVNLQQYVLGPDGYALTCSSYTSSVTWHPHRSDSDDRLEIELQIPHQSENGVQLEHIPHYYGEAPHVDAITVSIGKSLSAIAQEVLRRLVEPNRDHIARRLKDIAESQRLDDYVAATFIELLRLTLPNAMQFGQNGVYEAQYDLPATKNHHPTVEIKAYGSQIMQDYTYEVMSFRVTLGSLPYALTRRLLETIAAYEKTATPKE